MSRRKWNRGEYDDLFRWEEEMAIPGYSLSDMYSSGRSYYFSIALGLMFIPLKRLCVALADVLFGKAKLEILKRSAAKSGC